MPDGVTGIGIYGGKGNAQWILKRPTTAYPAHQPSSSDYEAPIANFNNQIRPSVSGIWRAQTGTVKKKIFFFKVLKKMPYGSTYPCYFKQSVSSLFRYMFQPDHDHIFTRATASSHHDKNKILKSCYYTLYYLIEGEIKRHQLRYMWE